MTRKNAFTNSSNKIFNVQATFCKINICFVAAIFILSIPGGSCTTFPGKETGIHAKYSTSYIDSQQDRRHHNGKQHGRLRHFGNIDVFNNGEISRHSELSENSKVTGSENERDRVKVNSDISSISGNGTSSGNIIKAKVKVETKTLPNNGRVDGSAYRIDSRIESADGIGDNNNQVNVHVNDASEFWKDSSDENSNQNRFEKDDKCNENCHKDKKQSTMSKTIHEKSKRSVIFQSSDPDNEDNEDLRTFFADDSENYQYPDITELEPTSYQAKEYRKRDYTRNGGNIVFNPQNKRRLRFVKRRLRFGKRTKESLRPYDDENDNEFIHLDDKRAPRLRFVKKKQDEDLARHTDKRRLRFVKRKEKETESMINSYLGNKDGVFNYPDSIISQHALNREMPGDVYDPIGVVNENGKQYFVYYDNGNDDSDQSYTYSNKDDDIVSDYKSYSEPLKYRSHIRNRRSVSELNTHDQLPSLPTNDNQNIEQSKDQQHQKHTKQTYKQSQSLPSNKHIFHNTRKPRSVTNAPLFDTTKPLITSNSVSTSDIFRNTPEKQKLTGGNFNLDILIHPKQDGGLFDSIRSIQKRHLMSINAHAHAIANKISNYEREKQIKKFLAAGKKRSLIDNDLSVTSRKLSEVPKVKQELKTKNDFEDLVEIEEQKLLEEIQKLEALDKSITQAESDNILSNRIREPIEVLPLIPSDLNKQAKDILESIAKENRETKQNKQIQDLLLFASGKTSKRSYETISLNDRTQKFWNKMLEKLGEAKIRELLLLEGKRSMTSSEK